MRPRLLRHRPAHAGEASGGGKPEDARSEGMPFELIPPEHFGQVSLHWQKRELFCPLFHIPLQPAKLTFRSGLSRTKFEGKGVALGPTSQFQETSVQGHVTCEAQSLRISSHMFVFRGTQTKVWGSVPCCSNSCSTSKGSGARTHTALGTWVRGMNIRH